MNAPVDKLEGETSDWDNEGVVEMECQCGWFAHAGLDEQPTRERGRGRREEWIPVIARTEKRTDKEKRRDSEVRSRSRTRAAGGVRVLLQ